MVKNVREKGQKTPISTVISANITEKKNCHLTHIQTPWDQFYL